MSNNTVVQSGSDARNDSGKGAAVQGEWLEIPLSQLVPSARNVRKVEHEAAALAELAGLIASQGLINPPTVIEQRNEKGKLTGLYEVIAGGRRLAALMLLVEQGRYGAEEPILCLLREAEDATAVSIAENAGRVELHPADEFEAFKLMLAEGKSIDDVAASFHVTPLVVKQRLQLANVAPEFIDLYRKGKVGMDVMKALALTTDHAAQRRVWKEVGSSRNSYVIRRALTQGEVEATDAVARFVGAKAYEKAGGIIRRDLFDTQHSGYFTDRALLEKLARAKLDKAASEALADGAAWAEVVPSFDSSARSDYVAVRQLRKKPTAKQQGKLDALQAEAAQLEKAIEEADDESYEALDAQRDAVLDKIDGIESSLRVDDPNELEKAGTVVSIDHAGKLHVSAQLLRKADAKAMRAQAPAEGTGVSDDTAASAEPRDVSDSLARRLSIQRTVALQVEVSRRPNVAVAAVTAELAVQVFGVPRWVDTDGWHGNSVGVRIRFDDLSRELDSAGGAACEALAADHAAWLAELRAHAPTGDVLGWLLGQSTETVLSLLAFCTAVRTDATVMGAARREVEADALAQAVALDMHAWWRAGAANYFDALPKPKIVEAIEEISGQPADSTVAKMKKGELAAHAEQLVAQGGAQWLPERLRG